MAWLGHRPLGLRGSPTGAGLCSLPSKWAPVERSGVRQIRHTPRYPVALGLGGESYENQHVGAAYASLPRWWRLHTARCIARMRPAYRPRLNLELRNSAIPAPSRKGGR
jgi:hypothetical protein